MITITHACGHRGDIDVPVGALANRTVMQNVEKKKVCKTCYIKHMKGFLTVGKYAGENVDSIYKKDKHYLLWISNKKGFKPEHVQKMVKEYLNKKEPCVN